ncbi:MAG: HPr family phosphocarrier protein [Pseudomonadota bacterium]
MPSAQVEIINKLGLHARAAAKLVKTAAVFASDITLERSEQCVSAKIIMGVMMLAASKGTTVVVSAEGEDAEEALDAVVDLINDRFGEDE